MALSPCCQEYVDNAEPKNPQVGKFTEKHQCPKGHNLNIIFECGKTLGDGWACGAVGVL